MPDFTCSGQSAGSGILSLVSHTGTKPLDMAAFQVSVDVGVLMLVSACISHACSRSAGDDFLQRMPFVDIRPFGPAFVQVG